MNSLRLGAFCLLATSLFVSPASAVLSSLTDPSSPGGADNVTLDSVNNLEWLDWTASSNISYDDILTMTGSGGTFEGWQHATRDQVRTLFNEASIDTSLWPGVTTNNDAGASGNALLALIGGTIISSQSQGITADPFSSSSQFFVQLITTTTSTISSAGNGSGKTGAQTAFGHALVRTATIPEPSSFLFFGAVSALIGCGRKR